MLMQNPKKKISLKLLKIGLTLVPFKKGNMLKMMFIPIREITSKLLKTSIEPIFDMGPF
jgi:hypothetical protein